MSSSIKDKHIVFTGKMEQGDRDEMKADAKKLGAFVQSDVNSKTDILVCGADVAVNSFMNVVIIIFGLAVGSTMRGNVFLQYETLGIFLIGLFFKLNAV